MALPHVSRRFFLRTAGGFVAAGGFSSMLRGSERPRVTNPRATSGDDAHEPDWKDRLTISVGPKHADLIGSGDKVIQAGVDYVTRLGGGTVRIAPGTFTMRNAVWLPSGVRLVGSGEETSLLKSPSVTTKLSDDSDWYDQEITLTEASGFQVGDGVCLRAKNTHPGANDVVKRTLVARSGNRFKLDRALRKNFWLKGASTVSTLFPILTSEYTADVVIENLTLDGNRANNEHLDGNHAGCIFLQDCNRYTIRNVTTRNYNGDGLSWQICHDVVVENCHSHDNADLGLHPGSGSQRPLIRGNRLDRNKIGIFFCWGVKHGLAENNRIDQSGQYGISIGHCDTDNLIRGNEVLGSGEIGILFRDDARGKTRDVTITNSELVETRAPMQRIGVRLGKETRDINLDDNKITGFATNVVDHRASS